MYSHWISPYGKIYILHLMVDLQKSHKQWESEATFQPNTYEFLGAQNFNKEKEKRWYNQWNKSVNRKTTFWCKWMAYGSEGQYHPLRCLEGISKFMTDTADLSPRLIDSTG